MSSLALKILVGIYFYFLLLFFLFYRECFAWLMKEKKNKRRRRKKLFRFILTFKLRCRWSINKKNGYDTYLYERLHSLFIIYFKIKESRIFKYSHDHHYTKIKKYECIYTGLCIFIYTIDKRKSYVNKHIYIYINIFNFSPMINRLLVFFFTIFFLSLLLLWILYFFLFKAQLMNFEYKLEKVMCACAYTNALYIYAKSRTKDLEEFHLLLN